MLSRENITKSSHNHKHPSLVLESLEPRLLLNVTGEWWENEDLSNFTRPGYGIPDTFYSDPATWNSTQTDLQNSFQQDYILSPENQPDAQNTLADLGPAPARGTTVLYLNFDEARVYSRSGDFWLGSNYIDVPGFDLSKFGWDGYESQAIDYITRFVQEDYAPYNVLVTAAKPDAGDYTTIYVGGSNDWFRPDSGVIGVATYDVGNRVASNYGFAFVEELGIYKNQSAGSLQNFSEYIANLITHEAAHTFGANHVNDTTATMNPYLPLSPRTTMFGRDSGQDTQSLMGENLGYSHGADDYGDDIDSAYTISTDTTIEGILQRRDDVDVIKFTANNDGPVTVDINTDPFGNLDSYITIIRQSDNMTVAQNDNSRGTDSYVSFNARMGQTYAVEVSSSGGSSSGTYELDITLPDDPPAITVTDSSDNPDDLLVDFGSVMTGTTANETFTISNTGANDLVLSAVYTEGQYTLGTINLPDHDNDDIIIPAGGSLDFSITFAPESTDTYAGQVIIQSNALDQEQLILELTGQGRDPQAQLSIWADGRQLESDNIISWNELTRNELGQKIVTLQNSGLEPLVINDIDITTPFIVSDSTLPDNNTLQPGETWNLTVTVLAAQRGELEGTLTISSNDPDQQVKTLGLDARIVGGVLTISDSSENPSDKYIDFGTVYYGEQPTHTITLTNTGDADLTIEGIELNGDFTLDTLLDDGNPRDDITLAVGESLTVNTAFTSSGIEDADGSINILTDDCEHPRDAIELHAIGQTNALEIRETDGSDDHFFDGGSFWNRSSRGIHVWNVYNHGNKPVTITLSLADGTDLQLSGPDTVELEAGQSYSVSVILGPGLARPISDRLTLSANDYNRTYDTVSVTAQPYALVGRHMPLLFTDNSGDRVKVSLNGAALAKVQLGDANDVDIKSIELLSGDSSAALKIRVFGNGSTRIGDINGTGSLGKLIAPQVELSGNGLQVDGSLHTLRLGEIQDASEVSYAGDNQARLKIGSMSGYSSINIDGNLKTLQVMNFLGGELDADSIDKMFLGSVGAAIDVQVHDLRKLVVRDGDLTGKVSISGSLDLLKLRKGDLKGSLKVGNDIGSIILNRGAITGSVKTGGSIGDVRARNVLEANIVTNEPYTSLNFTESSAQSSLMLVPLTDDFGITMDQPATSLQQW